MVPSNDGAGALSMEVLVFENVGHVLAHAGEAEEFVLDALDPARGSN
jgi:hypothetical protein